MWPQLSSKCVHETNCCFQLNHNTKRDGRAAHGFTMVNMNQPASNIQDAQMMRSAMCVAAPRIGPWRVAETDEHAMCGAWHLECAHHARERHRWNAAAKIQYGICVLIPRDVHSNVVVVRAAIAPNVVAIVWPLRHDDDGACSDVAEGQSMTIIVQQSACKHQALLMGGHPTNGIVAMNLVLDIGDGGVMLDIGECHGSPTHCLDMDDKLASHDVKALPPHRVCASSHDVKWGSEEADQSQLLVMP